MVTSTIEVIDAERVSEAEAKTATADRIARTIPPTRLEENEVEGQYPYWKYYRCGCGTVFRVLLDTDYYKYFYSPCCGYMYRA